MKLKLYGKIAENKQMERDAARSGLGPNVGSAR